MRRSGRQANQLREIRFTKNFSKYAEGSVLVEFGETKVICNASVSQGVPRFLKDSGQGWLTAEYNMLPRATHQRTDREASRGKQTGRTLEIQRLIGRSLRAAIDLKKMGDYTIIIDCDVIQADGGTRTAAITGGYLALTEAIKTMRQKKMLSKNPLVKQIASISVGIVAGEALLDLEYSEDSAAETDLNIVMTADGEFIELQGTAEKNAFSGSQLNEMLELGRQGVLQLVELQNSVLDEAS